MSESSGCSTFFLTYIHTYIHMLSLSQFHYLLIFTSEHITWLYNHVHVHVLQCKSKISLGRRVTSHWVDSKSRVVKQ